MKRWAILGALILCFAGIQYWITRTSDQDHSEELQYPQQPKPIKHPSAALIPGRAVVLKTSKGDVEFVLFEKDCPVTTKRIIDLVTAGKYNGVKIPRVETGLIQTSEAKAKVPGINIEIKGGLSHVPGVVAMARAQSPTSNTSSFYIAKTELHYLDNEYTVFGLVTKGLEIVKKLKPNDTIISASIRPQAQADLTKLSRSGLGESKPGASTAPKAADGGSVK